VSQIGQILNTNPFSIVETLTGNTGGPIGPTGNNINVVGAGVVSVAGNPATSTLTISVSGTIATTYDEDSGSATPAAGILNINGGTSVGGVATNINTIGSGNTVQICLNNNINLPNTNSAGTAGIYKLNSINFLNNYGTRNTFLGGFAGTLGLTTASATSNTGVGYSVLSSLTTGTQNTSVGALSSTLLTTGSYNTNLGYDAGGGLLTGSYNIIIGQSAGIDYVSAESSNIIIGNAGTVSENNVIRIGTQGSGNAEQDVCFIAGVYQGAGYGATYQPVIVDSHGQLSSLSSTNGQILIGGTGGSPAFETITAGAGITVTNGANSITIAATGTTTLTYTLVNTSPYVVLSTDEFLGVDCSGGAIQINLPNAPSTGRTYTIKDITGSAGTHNITVTTVGGAINIDAAVTYVMNNNYQSVNVLFNGTNYLIW
jgi:hypothetical protein